MKISYNWLKQFVPVNLEVEKVGELLTDLGLEVEGIEKIESIKGGLKGVVVGEVIECEKHANADRLRVTKVDLGNGEPVQIVCGAPNVAVGQKVPVATVGTVLYDENGNDFKIKKGNIRGEVSFGMICAEDELGLGKGHDGILVLENSVKVGTPAAEVFNIESDAVFEIGLTPNRADAMSHMGVARDLRAGLLQKNIKTVFNTPSVSDFQVDERTLKIDVDVQDSEKAPRYSGITITDIKIEESPAWLQNKLKAIGINPKNNVVDVTNYVMHELGQPLHAFDANAIRGGKIIVRTLAQDTLFETLDGVERKLDKEDLMICDGDEQPMCIAGVLGGTQSGITESTSSIFIESAYFNPVSVRKSAKRHGLNTDASFRFERGIDPNGTKYALKRAAILIKQIAGGKISSEIIDIYPNKIEDFQIFLSYEKVNKLIGTEIPQETIQNILASLEIKINNNTESGVNLTIPSYRVDVQREADVIEEILRVYGYNNVQFSQKLNTSIAYSKGLNQEKIQDIVANQLVAQGFNETMSNSLTKPEYLSLSELLKDDYNVTILNPLSNDLSVMRQSILFSGLETIAYNLNRKNKSLKLFEFGKTYHHFESGYHEQKHLSITLTGKRTKESWVMPQKKSDFFYLKGIVLTLLSRLGITKLTETPTKNDIFTEGIALGLGKNKLVNLGIIKKRILKEFGIKQEVLFADFDWDAILKFVHSKNIKVKLAPKFPEVKRDFALLLDEKVSFDEIYKSSFKTEGKLLKSVELFDVYQGDKLPKGKKSYAVSFVLRDDNKTLNDKQIDKIMQKLQQTFEKQLGAELRS